MNKRVLVCGAAGFIGTNLVAYLLSQGHRVIGADIKAPSQTAYFRGPSYLQVDLRDTKATRWLMAEYGPFEEVYQLAAEMGGMGYIQKYPDRIMRNSMQINATMARVAIAECKVPRFFFSSSVCVYRDMPLGAQVLTEEDAYPAMPDNDYGWEKLMAERLYLAHTWVYGTEVRIGRFQNTYGPYCDYTSERAKAPAALCRKAMEASKYLEVWGDGKAVRSFTHIHDLLKGVDLLMHSEERRPCNIGVSTLHSVEYLARMVIQASGKPLTIRHVEGVQGVRYRDFSKNRIRALGWQPEVPLKDGIQALYNWIRKKKCSLQPSV